MLLEGIVIFLRYVFLVIHVKIKTIINIQYQIILPYSLPHIHSLMFQQQIYYKLPNISSPSLHMLFISKNLFHLAFIILIIATIMLPAHSQEEEDKIDINTITQFPKDYNHDIYAGYLNVTELDKAFYYMMFMSQNEDADDPIVLWLGDGPGYSSLVSAVTENGPFLFQPKSTDMKMNPNAWNLKATLLYLESPCGVGFVKCKRQSLISNDTIFAQDTYVALVKFFQKFPQLKSNSFFIAGQGYAGVYIPKLAQEIIYNNQQQSKQDKKINLKGVLIGNGCTHSTQCYTGQVISRYQAQYLYSRGFIDDSQYSEYVSTCVSTDNEKSTACVNVQKKISQSFTDSKANIYNVYGTCYTTLKDNIKCMDMVGASSLFNREENRKGFHVQSNQTLIWTSVSTSINYTKQPGSSYPIVNDMIKYGLRIYYYSGDFDAATPIQGTLDWIKKYRSDYGATIKKSWRPWSADNWKSTSGMIWELDGITFWSVLGAGHMSSIDKPAQMKYILDRFLDERSPSENQGSQYAME